MLSSINFHPLVLIIAGLLLSLFGYRVQKLVLTIVCFLVGYTISNAIIPNFISDNIVILVINIIIGIVFSSLGYKIEKLALSATTAYLVYTSLTTYSGIIPIEMTFIIKIVISLLCGIASLLLLKPVLIIITSIAGSSVLLQGVATYITIPSEFYMIILIIIIILTALLQFKTNKR